MLVQDAMDILVTFKTSKHIFIWSILFQEYNELCQSNIYGWHDSNGQLFHKVQSSIMQCQQRVRAVVRGVTKRWRYHYDFTGRSDQDLAISSALILWLKALSNVFCLSAGLGSSDPAQCQLPAVQALFGLERWQGYLAPQTCSEKSSQKDKVAYVPQQICSRSSNRGSAVGLAKLFKMFCQTFGLTAIFQQDKVKL